MKTYITSICLILITGQFAFAQSFNLANNSNDENQMISASLGYEYSMTTRLAYGQKANTKIPIWILADVAIPMGNKPFDDLKARMGTQVLVKSMKKFALSARTQANYRQYQQNLVGMKSFGAEATAIVGRYTTKWAIEAELGFDKAIITHLKHTKVFKDKYADANDGWYIPTGGNWHYGINASRVLGKMMQISFNVGLTNAQGDNVDALIPAYMHIALSKSF